MLILLHVCRYWVILVSFLKFSLSKNVAVVQNSCPIHENNLSLPSYLSLVTPLCSILRCLYLNSPTSPSSTQYTPFGITNTFGVNLCVEYTHTHHSLLLQYSVRIDFCNASSSANSFCHAASLAALMALVLMSRSFASCDIFTA